MNTSLDRRFLHNIVSQPGEGRLEPVLGVSHIYKLEAQHACNALACIETKVTPGHGVAPHTHSREDELFYVASGMVEVVGDDLDGPVRLGRGGMFYSPRGRRHAFRNPGTDDAVLFIVMSPGANMQAMFGELSALTVSSPAMPAAAQVTALCADYGIAFQEQVKHDA